MGPRMCSGVLQKISNLEVVLHLFKIAGKSTENAQKFSLVFIINFLGQISTPASLGHRVNDIHTFLVCSGNVPMYQI